MILMNAPTQYITGELKDIRKFAWFPVRMFRNEFPLTPHIRYSTEEKIDRILRFGNTRNKLNGPIIWLEHYIQHEIYVAKHETIKHPFWIVISKIRECDKFLEKLAE